MDNSKKSDPLDEIEFGNPLIFHENGSFEEIESDNGSPSQLHQPHPLCNFDREPVKMPANPLAKKLLPDLDQLLSNLEKTTQLARENMATSNSFLSQSWMSLDLVARSTEGELAQIKEVLLGIEERMESEKRIAEKFWKKIDRKFDEAVHPSLKILNLKDRVKEFSRNSDGHKKAAEDLDKIRKECAVIEETLKLAGKLSSQIQATKQTDAKNLSDFSAALFEVEKILTALRPLAPKSFRIHEKKPSIGGFIDRTIIELNRLEMHLSRQFPSTQPGQTPLPSSSSSIWSDWNPTTATQMSMSSEKSFLSFLKKSTNHSSQK